MLRTIGCFSRDAQLPPTDLDWCWLFLGGRDAGKSHSMSAAVHAAVRAGLKRLHLIAPTTADFYDVNLEGKRHILSNPVALRKLVETRGASFIRGLTQNRAKSDRAPHPATARSPTCCTATAGAS